MKFTCPHCRHEHDLEEALMDADLIAIIKMSAVFGKHHHLVWAYCELFGISPLKTRRKKLRLLLEEVKRLFDTEEFDYQKRRYRISQAGIVEALNVMVHKHWTAHLANHNYLKKIMIGLTEASAKTESREAEKELRQREERLRHPYCEYPYQEEQIEPPTRVVHVPSRQSGALPRGNTGRDPGAELTPEQREENQRRVEDILKKIGG